MAAIIVVLLAACLLQHSSARTQSYPFEDDERADDDVAVLRLGKVLDHIVDSLANNNDKETTTLKPQPQANTKKLAHYPFPTDPKYPGPNYFFPHQLPGPTRPKQGCIDQRDYPSGIKFQQAPEYPYPTNNYYPYYPFNNAYNPYPNYPTNDIYTYPNYPNNNVFPPTCPFLPYLPPPKFPPSNYPPSNFPPTNYPPSNYPPSKFPPHKFPSGHFPPHLRPADATPSPSLDDQQPRSAYSTSTHGGVASQALRPSSKG